MDNNFSMNNFSISFSNTEQEGVMVVGNKVFIDGKELPPCPGKGNNSTVINRKVFVDGWEWVEGKDGKEGKWKRTLRALWHKWF